MEELEISEPAEEMLAALWQARERGAEEPLPRESLQEHSQEALRELLELGLVELRADRVALTTSGDDQASSVIRRERLAERLLADVIDVGDAVVAEAACRFEHLLRKGVDDGICTLLGHPRVCPHGEPIPRGPCCRQRTVAAGKVVSSLADLSPGEGGAVAYLQSQRRELGLIPGVPVVLRQRTPSFVVEVGNTQIAVDRETARDIYVRIAPAAAPPARASGGGRRFGFRFRRGQK
jgi:DtxR family Mn-dependent transcriptional regulator